MKARPLEARGEAQTLVVRAAIEHSAAGDFVVIDVRERRRTGSGRELDEIEYFGFVFERLFTLLCDCEREAGAISEGLHFDEV